MDAYQLSITCKLKKPGSLLPHRESKLPGYKKALLKKTKRTWLVSELVRCFSHSPMIYGHQVETFGPYPHDYMRCINVTSSYLPAILMSS